MRKSRRGSALVMATMSLLLMMGAVGLAADLGWLFYVRKSAQAAADAAALAAVKNSMGIVGQGGTINCASLSCADPPADCSAVSGASLTAGCQYAAQNGFSHGGHAGRQSVTLRAGASSHSTATGSVSSLYYVTARVQENVPQLFSAVFGNVMGTSGAHATAGIVNVAVPGTLILTNRNNDTVPFLAQPGTSIHVESGTRLDIVGSTIVHSSESDAGIVDGGGIVTSTSTQIRQAGNVQLNSNGSWSAPPTNGLADGALFRDPMRGKGQPPAPTGLIPRPVNKDTGLTTQCLPPTCSVASATYPPGNYYEAELKNGVWEATGKPMKALDAVNFSGGTWGDFVFFGGLSVEGTANTIVNFGPGRYIFAGVEGSLPVLDVKNASTVRDQTSVPGPNSDAGQIFIFTDEKYPGLQIPPAITSSIQNNLNMGSLRVQQATVNLHGLNPDSPHVPDNLKPFAPVAMWQDQRNSRIKYTPSGGIDNYCGNADPLAGCANNSPDFTNNLSPELSIQTGSSFKVYGTIYQPRGAWASVQSGSAFTDFGELQFITGAMNIESGSNVRMSRPTRPLMRRMVALVE
jgi:Putative Flp pilus-assembly TadE/G-like